MQMEHINWFPGHMAKTRREIKESLKLVDIVIEIRDARIAKSSSNPEIDKITKGKPRLILLNKSDLSDEKINKKWINALNSNDLRVIGINCLNGKGIPNIKPAIYDMLKEKHDKMKAKGLINIKTKAMVVGIPNCGKSTFINRMAKGSIAKTGDRPGVTKSKQWIRTQIGIELLDTPGILWPKFEDEKTSLNLAFTGAIKDEIMDIESLSYKLIENLAPIHGDKLMERYKIDEISDNPLLNMENIARKRGMLIKKGEIDYNRVSIMLLDEFRGGKIGKISLEEPE